MDNDINKKAPNYSFSKQSATEEQQTINQDDLLTKLSLSPSLLKAFKKANDLKSKSLYKSAQMEYSKLIDSLKSDLFKNETESFVDFNALVFSNRSFCYYNLEMYKEALKDSELCSFLKPEYPLGHYRNGKALTALKLFKDAMSSFKQAVKLEPTNPEFKRMLLYSYVHKENCEMGFEVKQLLPGRDICLNKSTFNIIQNKINKFAIEMKNFIYIITDNVTKQSVVIDPCWDVDGIIKILKRERLDLVGIIITHYHFDHVGGTPPAPFDQLMIKVGGFNSLTKKLFPKRIKTYVHTKDYEYIKKSNSTMDEANVIKCKDGHTISLGKNCVLKLLHTPGHSMGSQCILLNERRLFSGDTLFIGNIGRLNLPGSSSSLMYESLLKIRDLNDECLVYPGHCYGGEWTTIYEEKNFGALKLGSYHEWVSEKSKNAQDSISINL